jgi:hypothetical protein
MMQAKMTVTITATVIRKDGTRQEVTLVRKRK